MTDYEYTVTINDRRVSTSGEDAPITRDKAEAEAWLVNNQPAFNVPLVLSHREVPQPFRPVDLGDTELKRVAYYSNEGFYDRATATYQVARITENEAGYVALRPGFSLLEEAQDRADELNAEINLSKSEVFEIVASSLAASNLH